MAVTYREAGVDIDRGDALIERIKPLARATKTPWVLDDLGGFAGLCQLPSGIEDPILVSGTDGVGTKLKVAFASGVHDSVGQDLVAMCVNDVLTTGAQPLFFLDYFASSRLEVDVAEAVIRGVSDGCRLAGCALLGGETAELPGMYAPGEYDLAGFAVGVASRSALLGPARVQVGDELVAVASSGLHSNGYSLARRVLLDQLGLALDAPVAELGCTLQQELLKPTRIYAGSVARLLELLPGRLHALCHVTGGGVAGNLVRVLGAEMQARIALSHPRPAVFDLIARGGPVEEAEMRRTFNLGIGLIAVVEAGCAGEACRVLADAGERVWPVGSVVATPGSPASVAIDA